MGNLPAEVLMGRYHGRNRDQSAQLAGLAVSVLAVLVLVALFAVRYANAEPPEDQARTFLTTLGYDDVRVICVNVDSDGDGYVSCTGNAAGTIVAVECRTLGGGCRMQRLAHPIGNPQ